MENDQAHDVGPEQAILVRQPAQDALPVLVSIPHFGTKAASGFGESDYREQRFKHFARGFADAFAADLYGDLNDTGATVLATRLSRMYVDVNRRRDHYDVVADEVRSSAGVVRTHTRSDVPIFTTPLSEPALERRLRAYFDPYFRTADNLLSKITARHGSAIVLDAHTGSARRMTGHEVILGTSRGQTASTRLVNALGQVFQNHGFKVARDIKGYAGGEVVRRLGLARQCDAQPSVEAIQIEVNAGLLQLLPHRAFIDALIRGEQPSYHQDNFCRLADCMRDVAETAARELSAVP